MKKPFEIHKMLQLIEAAIAPFPKAALFELYDRGYTSLLEQLVACIISIRTLDETTVPVAERLFAEARTAGALLELERETMMELLIGTTFPAQKADTIKGIADAVIHSHGGILPADADVLMGLKGVGPKCAHLALGIATGYAVIGVDVHVHRVTNRWGYVSTKTPEKTMVALEDILRKSEWININRLLVPFGKHICTGQLPKCNTCAVLGWCRQVGVTRHR